MIFIFGSSSIGYSAVGIQPMFDSKRLASMKSHSLIRSGSIHSPFTKDNALLEQFFASPVFVPSLLLVIP